MENLSLTIINGRGLEPCPARPLPRGVDFSDDLLRCQTTLLHRPINSRPPSMGPVCGGKKDIAMTALQLLLILRHVLRSPPSRATAGPGIRDPVVEYLSC